MNIQKLFVNLVEWFAQGLVLQLALAFMGAILKVLLLGETLAYQQGSLTVMEMLVFVLNTIFIGWFMETIVKIKVGR